MKKIKTVREGNYKIKLHQYDLLRHKLKMAYAVLTLTIVVLVGMWGLRAVYGAETSLEGRIQVDPDFGIQDIITDAGQMLTPFGGFGRYGNVLLRSEEVNDAAWVVSGVSVSANSTSAPNKQTTADSLVDDTTGGGYVQQNVTVTSAATYTGSVWLKGTGTQTVSVQLIDANGTSPTTSTKNITLTTDWVRYNLSHTTSADTTSLNVRINHTSTASDTLYVWGAQLEKASSVGVYAKTTTSSQSSTTGISVNGDIFVSGTINGSNTGVTGAQNISSGDFGLNTGGGDYYFPASVGIGTTSPIRPLHVKGSGDTRILVEADGGVAILKANSTTQAQLTLRDEGASINQKGYNIVSDGGTLTFRLLTDDEGLVQQDNILVLKNDGNVGIGTPNPGTNKLKIVDTNAYIYLDASEGAGIFLDRGGTGQGSQVLFTTAGTQSWSISQRGDDGGVNKLHIRDEVNARTDMTFDGSGNVGIGTTGPGADLHVVGPTNETNILAKAKVTGYSSRLDLSDFDGRKIIVESPNSGGAGSPGRVQVQNTSLSLHLG
ncbi:hypothetical protein MYX07_06280, partial [Patescibacteria group bacterium AH-259-L07]|nr:hypothetical protein [Patescibacteria group bacterium AH-259-L07]